MQIKYVLSGVSYKVIAILPVFLVTEGGVIFGTR